MWVSPNMVNLNVMDYGKVNEWDGIWYGGRWNMICETDNATRVEEASEGPTVLHIHFCSLFNNSK